MKKSKKLSLPQASNLLKRIVLKAHQNAQRKNCSIYRSLFIATTPKKYIYK